MRTSVFFKASMALMAVIMLFAGNSRSQISHGGAPSFNQSNAKIAVPTVYTDVLDNEVFNDQDMNQVKGGGALRVGIVQHQEIDVLKSAKVVANDETTTRLLAVSSEGATYIALNFSIFMLPDGAELYFYDRSGTFVLGSFNASDVKDNGTFYTQAIPGDMAYIEYTTPADAEPGQLVIDAVVHGYKDIFNTISDQYEFIEEDMKGPHGTAEGDCHINVKCSEGQDWKDQIRSVVAIEVRTNYGSYMCSGAMINNTNQDRKPYCLSAYHCQDFENAGETLNSFVFYFLYQTLSCSSTSGVSNNSVTGATIKAKLSRDEASDFLLMLLDSDVPDNYKPYYAGWDRQNVMYPTTGCCIHHPGGDFKKISIPRTISRMNGYYSDYYEVYWYTGANNKGVTEPGSSGSPLFNGDKRIIGQLCAGTSACDNMGGSDTYGRLNVSWNHSTAQNASLSSWLDPAGTGVYVLDGLDYKVVGIDEPQPVKVHDLAVYPNPSNGMVHFDTPALGSASYVVYDLAGRPVLEGSTVLTATSQAVNLTSLPSGSYLLTLVASTGNYSATVVIKK